MLYFKTNSKNANNFIDFRISNHFHYIILFISISSNSIIKCTHYIKMTNEIDEIFFWKFSKLTNFQNYHEWNRQMINVMRIAKFYEFLDLQNVRKKFVKSNDEIWKTMLYIQKRNFEQNFLIWIRKNSTFVDRIVNMCNFIIQQLFDSVWIAMKTWNYLKKRYLSQNWFHKWFVFNRLKQIHYSNCKNVTKYEIAYKNIFKKIIDLKITMKNAIMIKMFNNFDSVFETFLIVKNNETKKNNDFFDIDKFIIVVKQKENRINLINFNLIRIDDDKNNNNNNNRDDRNFRNNRENERDTNDNNNFVEFLCKKCYIIYQFDIEHCSNKNEICDNNDCENSRNHKKINCIWLEKTRYFE